MADVTLLYVPCSGEEEAAAIASGLIEQRLIACANILSSRSLYRWNGTLTDSPETILLCKTVPGREAAARARILEMHSYDAPCVLSWSAAQANRDFAAWVAGEVFGPESRKDGED